MDNNQYFFSNERSNDSKMIGGSGPGMPPMAPMPGMAGPMTMMPGMPGAASVGGPKNGKGKGKNSPPPMPMALGRGRAMGPMMRGGPLGRGRGGRAGRGRGAGAGGPGNGPGGQGPQQLDQSVPVSALSTIPLGSSQAKSSSVKDKKVDCKEEKTEINKLKTKNDKLEGEIDALTQDMNRLSTILLVYENQFKEFNAQKEILDQTIIKLKEQLVTQETQDFSDKTKAMIAKRTNQKEAEAKEAKPPNTAGQPNAAPPPPNAAGQPNTAPPPQPNAAGQAPPPNAGQAQQPPNARQAPLQIPNIKEQNEEEIKASFGMAFKGIGEKAEGEQEDIISTQEKAKSNDFGASLKSIMDSFNSKQTFTQNDITLAVQGISAAIGTLFTAKKVMKSSFLGMGGLAAKAVGIDPIKIAKKAIPQIITDSNVKSLAQKIFEGKDAAARKPLIEEFVKEYIKSLGKTIIEEAEESAKDKEAEAAKDEGTGTAAKDEGQGQDQATSTEGQGTGTAEKDEGQGQDQATSTEGQGTGTVEKDEGQGQDQATSTEGQGQSSQEPVQTATTKALDPGKAQEPVALQTPNPQNMENKTGKDASSTDQQAKNTKQEIQNLEKPKKKENEACEKPEDCEGDLDCKDKICKTKASSGGSRRKKTRRRRGRRRQRGSGRKKTKRRSKTN